MTWAEAVCIALLAVKSAQLQRKLTETSDLLDGTRRWLCRLQRELEILDRRAD